MNYLRIIGVLVLVIATSIAWLSIDLYRAVVYEGTAILSHDDAVSVVSLITNPDLYIGQDINTYSIIHSNDDDVTIYYRFAVNKSQQHQYTDTLDLLILKSTFDRMASYSFLALSIFMFATAIFMIFRKGDEYETYN